MLPSQLYPQFFLLFAKQTKIEKLHYEFFKSYPKIYKKFYEEKKKKNKANFCLALLNDAYSIILLYMNVVAPFLVQ